MSREHQNNYRSKWHIVLGSFAVIAIIIVAITVGFGIANIIFKYVGRPPELGSHIIVGIFGIFTLGVISKVTLWILDKTGYSKKVSHARRINETLEALNRISKGDFSVSLKTEENDPFTELNQSVNKMAQELGNMETLRQDFISNVSHEIQSPLTSISGFAALLKTDLLSETERAHYLNIIETESKRLSRLSDNLLKLSSLEAQVTPLAMSEFRLDKQLRGAVLMLEPQWHAKGINVNVELEKVTIDADEELLQQVWINLLHNAVKFTPEGGTIKISLCEQGDLAECRIQDSGIGIPELDQIHIFERFYKVDKSRDRSFGGNGLGLSICKKIIELHSGTIELESKPGVGTVFVARLKNK